MSADSTAKFERVSRPDVMPWPSRPGTFAEALRETLTTGDAVSVPIGTETYAVVRNRVCGGGTPVARRMKASLRTCRSADGLAVLFWLVPKDVSDNGGAS